MSRAEMVVHWWANDMRSTEVSPHRRRGIVAVRWALIALCAGLIVFSDHMAGRLGFAALLLLALIVARYGRWHERLRDSEPLEPRLQPPAQPRAPEVPERRREAQQ
jgi:hypothetical protein